MATGSAYADAWIIGGRYGHSRFYDHFGTEPDTVVVLDGTIGPYPSGTTVHAVLASMVARLEAIEGRSQRNFAFGASAWINSYIQARAIVRRSASGTRTVNAEIRRGGSYTFTANSLIARHPTVAFSADAYLIDLVC